MVATHSRRIKEIIFELGATEFQCQVESWSMDNNTPEGEKRTSLCPDGEFREEVDPDWALTVTFFADWRSGGISDYLYLNDQETVNFRVDHLPGIVGEHVRWTGQCQLRAPNVGGEGKQTETFEVTFPILGEPDYTRVG